ARRLTVGAAGGRSTTRGPVDGGPWPPLSTTGGGSPAASFTGRISRMRGSMCRPVIPPRRPVGGPTTTGGGGTLAAGVARSAAAGVVRAGGGGRSLIVSRAAGGLGRGCVVGAGPGAVAGPVTYPRRVDAATGGS